MIGDRTTGAYALVAAALILAIAASLISFAAHGADTITECSSARGHDGMWWSYREIDGRRCWYRGQPGRSKSLLRWGFPSPRSSAAVDRPEIEQAPSKVADTEPRADSTELTARALANREALWQPTTEDQEKAFTCCWPDSEPLTATLTARSVEGNQPLKVQERYTPIEMPRATPPARPLWPFMLLMLGLLVGSILFAKRRLT